ncbi:MAG: MBL fold metallo-hydrolase [Flavobacteriales bacterium]|nr:MBL fold metallo-hydrolase [Flavobacteriales bacterium]
MKIRIWGCRGSLPSPGPEKNIFGGNTSCVQITHNKTCIILDGGSGIQRLGIGIDQSITKIDILLTHLHIDHIMGLGFFQPFYNPNITINIWGPSASKEGLQQRLRRYFSPPIFPVQLKELPSKPNIIEINSSQFEIDDFKITSEYVCHPGPTVGYRLQLGDTVFTYIPDHEPALGASDYPNNPEWTSGYSLAKDADLLIHDAQYKTSEYTSRVGWGHSSFADAVKFAELTKVKKMLLFHHDPLHTDETLKELFAEIYRDQHQKLELELAQEGNIYFLT